LIARWENEAELGEIVSKFPVKGESVHVIAHAHIPAGKGVGRVAVMPHDAEAFARALYAELHECDRLGAEVIIVEAPPSAPEWAGIADRLRRAAA
jgi:L-threonylcarbamoyladenylate synthase